MSYYYRRCPACRAYLDPGEVCKCTKKAAVSAANADGGGVGNGLISIVSSPMISDISENASNKNIDKRRENIARRIMALPERQFDELLNLLIEENIRV